jgi:hypothetical protein
MYADSDCQASGAGREAADHDETRMARIRARWFLWLAFAPFASHRARLRRAAGRRTGDWPARAKRRIRISIFNPRHPRNPRMIRSF